MLYLTLTPFAYLLIVQIFFFLPSNNNENKKWEKENMHEISLWLMLLLFFHSSYSCLPLFNPFSFYLRSYVVYTHLSVFFYWTLCVPIGNAPWRNGLIIMSCKSVCACEWEKIFRFDTHFSMKLSSSRFSCPCCVIAVLFRIFFTSASVVIIVILAHKTCEFAIRLDLID